MLPQQPQNYGDGREQSLKEASALGEKKTEKGQVSKLSQI